MSSYKTKPGSAMNIHPQAIPSPAVSAMAIRTREKTPDIDLWDSETVDSTMNASNPKDGSFTGGTSSGGRLTNDNNYKSMGSTNLKVTSSNFPLTSGNIVVQHNIVGHHFLQDNILYPPYNI